MATAYSAREPVDFAGLMADVATRLFGPPNDNLSKGERLRFGRRGSVEVDTREGWFDDHEANVRGGVLDLIQHKQGGDKASALQWLESEGLKEKSPPVQRVRGALADAVYQRPRAVAGTFYNYEDERGEVLFRVERRGKDAAPPFLQHGPDGRGGFHSARGCMQGVRRIPYRLPELVAADPERVVFLTEGEKDADRLAGLGLIATTNPGGCGKFTRDMAEPLRGRRVIILQDNDEGGQRHVDACLLALAGIAEAAAPLLLPGLPPKGDVSDWLDAGNDVEALKTLAEAALEEGQPKPLVAATPFRWRAPEALPLRPWVYGRQLLRGTVSLVVAPGATGKTALLTGMALALVTGRSLLGKAVWDGPKRVWSWNLEDSEEDLARLILAAARHWNISEADMGDRLFVDSALDGAELKTAIEDRDGFRIQEPVNDALVAELKRRRIDVLIVDPFISSHGVNENDNSAIDAVAKKWARVAVEANCAIVLSHHTRKLAGGEANAESARGAKALVDAARSAVALNRMTDEESTRYGIEGEARRRFFRAYDDKANRAPPADASDWYQLLSVDLGNGVNGLPGDSIQVAAPWSPPDAFDGITTDDLRRVQGAVAAGEWRKSEQAEGWVGVAVAEALGLDAAKPTDKARIRKLLKEWIANDVLREERRRDGHREERPFIIVGKAVED